MYQECLFNEKRDLGRTIEGMAVDMTAAIETGIVQDTGVDIEFNELVDVELVGSRIHDQFDALDRQKSSLDRAAAQIKSNSSVNPEKGETD